MWAVVMVVGMVFMMPHHAAANIDLYMSSDETHRLLGESFSRRRDDHMRKEKKCYKRKVGNTPTHTNTHMRLKIYILLLKER